MFSNKFKWKAHIKPIPEKIKTPYVTFLNKQNILANKIPYYLK